MTNYSDNHTTFEVVGAGFTLAEATKLMHQEVMHTKDLHEIRSLQNTGLVSGILHLNEEIELVVQFYDHIEQFTQSEFEDKLTVLSND